MNSTRTQHNSVLVTARLNLRGLTTKRTYLLQWWGESRPPGPGWYHRESLEETQDKNNTYSFPPCLVAQSCKPHFWWCWTESYSLNLDWKHVCVTGSLLSELTLLETLHLKESLSTFFACCSRVPLFWFLITSSFLSHSIWASVYWDKWNH